MSPRGSTERLDLLETLAAPTSLRKINPVGLSPSSSASDLTQLKGKTWFFICLVTFVQFAPSLLFSYALVVEELIASKS